MMKSMIAKFQEIANKAKEVMDTEEFQNIAAGSIGTLGIIFQIKMATKFYKAMIPAIKSDESRGLKIAHIVLTLYMTYVYAYNVGYILESCEPSKKLEDQSLDGFDDEHIYE